jgi:hypothetical protein
MMGKSDGPEKAYVPADLESTGEIPVYAQPTPGAGLFDKFFAAEDDKAPPVTETVAQRYGTPVTDEQLVPRPPAASPSPVAVPPGGVPPSPPAAAVTFPPTDDRPRTGRPSPRILAALAAAGAAVLLAGGITMLFRQTGGAAKVPGSCTACSSSTRKTAGAGAPTGPKLTYRTVDRQVGYFEGTVTIVNGSGRPMPSWTLSFSYPGADVHNAWDVVLQQTGQDVVIVNELTAPPIAPGESLEVRFGGAGTPTMPADCRLNGLPCTFTVS